MDTPLTAAPASKTLGFFALAMMSVAAIVNLRSIPLMASVGYQAIFFYLFAAITFLLPSAMVCASLASRYPQAGGLYAWVTHAFGEPIGFFAIWSEWFNNVISFPATASFIATAMIYLVYPAAFQNKLIVFALVTCLLWGCSFYNCLGIIASSRLNILGAIFGTLLPAMVIIALAVVWLSGGHSSPLQFTSLAQLLPPLHIGSVVFLTGVLSSYAGMQITAFHAPNVRQPQRNFPLAILIATVLIVSITLFSALAIAAVVPAAEITLTAGVVQGFHYFFQAFHLPWATGFLIVLIVLSGISSLTAWLLAPARGMAVAAARQHFPSYFAKQSKRGIPVRLLMLQAGIATFLAISFIFLPTISQAFWLLMVLTSQFTLIMYVLLFAAGMVLMQKPAQSAGWFSFRCKRVFCGIGLLVSLGAYFLGFFPPEQLHFNQLWQFESWMFVGNALYLFLPILIYRRKTRVTQQDCNDSSNSKGSSSWA